MIEHGLYSIERNLRSTIESEINRLGIMFRIFSRIKDSNSIEEKKSRKNYSKDGEKMQDVVGFRIVTYFNDDVPLLFQTIKNKFEYDNSVYDEPLGNIFEPSRKNLVCKLPPKDRTTFNEIKQHNNSFDIIDDTFEVQFRTTLSEGWHEVEHNMRYKCKKEWAEFHHENRMMNGVYAALEANDHTMKALFDNLAYQNYRKKEWEAMLRTKFRLRFKLSPLNGSIVKLLDEEPSLAKALFKADRLELLESITNSNIFITFSFDNIVFLLNHLKVKNEKITKLTPGILLDQFNECFTQSLSA